MEPNTPRAVVKEFKQASLFCRKNTIKNLYGAEKKNEKLPTSFYQTTYKIYIFS